VFAVSVNLLAVSSSVGLISTSQTAISTSLGNVSTSLGNVSTSQTAISTSLGNVSTSLGNVSTSQTAISTSLGNVSTSLGNVSSSVTGVSTSLGNVSTSLSSVSTAVTALDKKVDANRKLASQGIAAVAAMAAIPDSDGGKTGAIGVGLGSYDGQTAIAIGGSLSVSQKIKLRAGVASGVNGSGQKPVVQIGARIQW
jgi:trimeric autotransporter adhesin